MYASFSQVLLQVHRGDSDQCVCSGGALPDRKFVFFTVLARKKSVNSLWTH